MVTAWELQEMLSHPLQAAVGELEAELIGRCRAREPAALRQFVTQYQRMVFAFVGRALGPDAPVDDLAQEVFLRASQALDRFELRGPAKVSTWLLAIAAHVVADARKRRRLRLVAPEQALLVPDPSTPETEAQRRELAAALARAGAQLSEDQRDVFILAEFHGLSMAEIAQVVGAPENTVKQRLFRARDRLRALLAEMREE